MRRSSRSPLYRGGERSDSFPTGKPRFSKRTADVFLVLDAGPSLRRRSFDSCAISLSLIAVRRQVTNTFLFARDGYTCQYCDKHKSELRGRQLLTRDHVVSVFCGVANSWDNVMTSRSACNRCKDGRLA